MRRFEKKSDVFDRCFDLVGLAVFDLDIRLDLAVSDLFVVDNRLVRKLSFAPSASALAERKFCAPRRWAKFRDSLEQARTEFWERP